MTYKSQLFNSSSETHQSSDSVQTSSIPQTFMGRMWNNTRWGVETALSGLARPIAQAFNPIGEGVGTGLVNGAKKELEKMVQPEGPLATQLHQTIEQSLLKQLPQELIQLKQLVKKSVAAPLALTAKDIQSLCTLSTMLIDEEAKLLKQLSPELSLEEIQLFKDFADYIQTVVDNATLSDPFDCLDIFKQEIKEEKLQLFQNFDQAFNLILDKNQGALVQAMDYVQNTLFNEEKGVLPQIETFKKKGIEQLNESLTGQAHPLLSKSRKKLIELRKAIINDNPAIIKKLSKELKGLIEQLETEKKWVFPKKGVSKEDLNTFKQLTRNLSAFYSKKPPKKHNMLKTVEKGLSVIQRHYESYEGIAARTGAILQETIAEAISNAHEAIDPVLTRVEKSYEGIAARTGAILQETIAEAISNAHEAIDPVLTRVEKSYEGIAARTGAILQETIAEAISNAHEAIDPVLTRVEKSYEGMAARTGEIVQETIAEAIDPVLTRVENLPRVMTDKLLGRTALDTAVETINRSDKKTKTEVTISQSESNEDAASLSEGYEGTISQFLENGSSFLKNILGKGSQAISQQALSTFTSVLTLGLQQMLDKMGDSDAFHQPRTILNGIITSLSNAHQNGNWGELYQNITNASQTLKPVKLYINGFRISNTNTSSQLVRNAEGIYSDSINALQEAMDPPPSQDSSSQDWKTLARVEKDKLINNTANYLTIKHIYEYVCNLHPRDDQFYLRLLMKSREKGIDQDNELKKIFFEELAKSNISFIKKTYAEVQYFFYGSIVKYYTKKASNIYFDEVFQYIDQQKLENFDTFRNQAATNFTRYLTILGGAYQNVANNPHPTGTLSEMLKSELGKKESNLGFETKDLYLEFAQIVLKKTTGTGIVGWITKKLVGNPEEIIGTIVNKSLASMQDAKGYTHALNSVIREQLEEIWKLLQEDQAKRQTNPNAETQDCLSSVKRNELSELVKNLFEILGKSKCQTRDELRDLIQGKLLSAKVNQAIDDLFIEEVIEKVTSVLAVSIQSLIKEDQLQKLAYKFASLVNRTFEIGEEVTLEETQEEERKISKLGDQILRLVVSTAVEEKFDFNGKKQQVETNRFITDLHNNSTEFFTATRQDLEELTKMEFSSLAGRNKINKIVENTLAYQAQCYESSFRVKSHTINSDNKDEIGERHLGIAQQSKLLVQSITQLKQHSKALESITTAAPHLKSVKTLAATIHLRLSRSDVLTTEDLAFCESQLSILNVDLENLRKMPQLKELVEQIAVEMALSSTLLVDMCKATKISSFCKSQLLPGSLLDLAIEEKKKKQSLNAISAMTASSALNHLMELKREILSTFDDSMRPELLAKLASIEEAKTEQQIDTARQELLNLYNQADSQATLSIKAKKESYDKSYQKVITSITTSHLLEPTQEIPLKKAIQESLQAAQENLEVLAKWESEHIEQIAYVNFSLVDTKGLQDWASGLVFNRVEERLDGFMNLLKREETYRYGLLHHLFLLPYVRATYS